MPNICVELSGLPGSNYCMYLSCHGDPANVSNYFCVYENATGSVQERNHARISNVSPFFWATDQVQQYLIKRESSSSHRIRLKMI